MANTNEYWEETLREENSDNGSLFKVQNMWLIPIFLLNSGSGLFIGIFSYWEKRRLKTKVFVL